MITLGPKFVEQGLCVPQKCTLLTTTVPYLYSFLVGPTLARMFLGDVRAQRLLSFEGLAAQLAVESSLRSRLLIYLGGLGTLLSNHFAVAAPEKPWKIVWIEGLLLFLLFIGSRFTDWDFVRLSRLQLRLGFLVLQVGV